MPWVKWLPIPLGLLLLSCADGGPKQSPNWLGDACGVANLQFTLDTRRKLLVLSEHQVSGSVMSETGEVTTPTITNRQRLIERALPCLEREAKRRGLNIEYPVLHVDA